MPRVPIWFGITCVCLCIGTIIFIAKDDARTPHSQDPRTPREQRLDKELQRENAQLQHEVQKEIRRIENKN
ncbi:hypothetical protein UFOVP736_1 [uncultured Caudovirales phage]|uniref:Uncharacterized protein n=1 Tax=uncultured Caudovirales phage TaxID=2100421 RepID=A0A6J7X0H0_9CAUD|nr:hypothetical protein UFOVP705_80 [uncultured Caudovirales phage]CAB5223691.1 hypothetical protein UFOVP736_1 [uncultured Caudovirales phage]